MKDHSGLSNPLEKLTFWGVLRQMIHLGEMHFLFSDLEHEEASFPQFVHIHGMADKLLRYVITLGVSLGKSRKSELTASVTYSSF